MGQRIDQFCENLRQKLTMAESGIEGLKTKINAKATHVEDDVQSHLGRVRDRVEQNRAKVAAANTEMAAWVDQRKMDTTEKIAGWKAKRDMAKLQGRADAAERYAAASIDVAAAAIDEAEQASLEAWLTRQDADSAAGARSSAA
jgi:hypothetical protein